MNNQPIQQLRALKLPGFREAEANNLSYAEFLSMLLTDELEMRISRRIARLLHRAGLGREMTLESFDFAFNPSINAKRIKSLASCRFMERGEGVFFPACRQAGSVPRARAKPILPNPSLTRPVD